MKNIPISNFFIGSEEPLTVICGPCVIESEAQVMEIAENLKNLFSKHSARLIFKASYDKANRSSIHSFEAQELKRGLKSWERVKETFEIPIFTDVHSPEEAREAGSVCDIIQIPAFLCRQTDLLLAAGHTKAAINIKKGQFMAPWDMKNVIEKILSTGNERILLTDRGTTFGYNNLVSDFRSIPIMQSFGFPVFFDATHAVQLPGGLSDRSGGQREFIPVLARAAVAAGCQGIYAEAHPHPATAKSDAASMIPLEELPALLNEWERIYEVVHTPCLKPN